MTVAGDSRTARGEPTREGQERMTENPKNRPVRETAEFHETDFYSRFENPPVPGVPESEAENRLSWGEIDEGTIGELMDAALVSAPARLPSASTALESRIEEDWTTEIGPDPNPPQRGSNASLSPQPARLNSQLAQGSGQDRTLSKPQGLSTNWRGQGLVFGLLLLALAAVAIVGGSSFVAFRLGGPEAVFEKAAGFHEDRDYLQAILLYQELRGLDEGEDPVYQARLAFLTGGAYESLWREDQSETAFAEALRSYQEAVGLDRGEMRVYAVDSLLAKAELLINRSQKSEQPDPSLEEQAWACLAKLMQEPEYRLNPAVHRGVPHRMLAERTEKEDPETAIQLLREARDAQGELEEGVENLRIAQIFLNLLQQPDQAMEHFELVRQNELANEEIRKSAEVALKNLRSADLRSSPLYGQEVEEILPAVEEE